MENQEKVFLLRGVRSNMAIIVKCQHCGHVWSYKGKLIKTNCPKCRYKVNVLKQKVNKHIKCIQCKKIWPLDKANKDDKKSVKETMIERQRGKLVSLKDVEKENKK